MLAALLGACDKPPTTPRPLPSPDQPPGLTRLELAGPDSVPPGDSAQFTATAFYTDGSSRDVSGESTWRTTSSSVLSISSAGVATGHDRGESLVQVSFAYRGSSKNVMVLPAGTFRLSGWVRDAGLPVSGAQVAVSAGSAAGLVATTVGERYSLYGVFGDTEIRVTKPGYDEQKKRVPITSHQTLDFELVLSSPREMVDGTYTLTISAAPECRSKLPDELLERRYTAVLVQAGRAVTATLQGATFYTSGSRRLNTFRGVVEPGLLTFQLVGASEYYYYGYFFPGDVLEQLTTSTFLSVGGSVVMPTSGARRSGTLNGAIETFAGPGPLLRRILSCDSSGHRFELTK